MGGNCADPLIRSLSPDYQDLRLGFNLQPTMAALFWPRHLRVVCYILCTYVLTPSIELHCEIAHGAEVFVISLLSF